MMNFSRRDFTKMLFGAAALGLIETSTLPTVFGQSKRSINWLSVQTASGEGRWTNLKIEGKLPRDLNGTLFRTAPGMAENFGAALNHLFDGDAYLSSWCFRDGRAELFGRFLPTPARLKEAEAKKMLFNEYGTLAENPNNPGKNQPSVNVVEWNGKLLGLSEGGLPTVINPANFDFEGYENFQKVVPDYLTFTAHPRFDSETGDMYAWGFEKRPPGNLQIFRIRRKENRAELLYKFQPKGFFMTHDALLTKNYFMLVIPPLAYDVQAMMKGKSMGDSLSFNESQPTRLLLFPRESKTIGGAAQPIEIELPSEIAFHYGNAFETADGKITFEMISGSDRNLLERLRSWKRDPFRAGGGQSLPQTLKQVTVDIVNQKAISSVDLIDEVEFPRYDHRLTGQRARYLYVAERVYEENAAIVRVDLDKKSLKRTRPVKNRTIGEPVFVPHSAASGERNEDRGWILAQGYDAVKDETFLEIRDAQTLEFEARIWAGAGRHIPLGFHGNFYAGL
jgi:all-trans-8'-apo-beta-carotenal 15,15'-oxygenase